VTKKTRQNNGIFQKKNIVYLKMKKNIKERKDYDIKKLSTNNSEYLQNKKNCVEFGQQA
jgi:hypothetical protein